MPGWFLYCWSGFSDAKVVHPPLGGLPNASVVSPVPVVSLQCLSGLSTAIVVSPMPEWSLLCQNGLSDGRVVSFLPEWSL